MENFMNKQTDGVAMSSPLSSFIANFYLEASEQLALASSPFKPSFYRRYVDDMFLIWPHGQSRLQEFVTF